MNTEQSVWNKVECRGDFECWPWKGCAVNGYGVFRLRGKNVYAHRLIKWLDAGESFPLHVGRKTADSIYVLHSCDNRACCNPRHLRVGTPQENMNDKVARNRLPNLRGQNGGGAKLTNESALRIREAVLFGAKQKDLASAYGVSRAAICLLVNGKTFADVA